MENDLLIMKLKDLQQLGDSESAHQLADKALCDFLISLGYADIVEEFHKVDKWYA